MAKMSRRQMRETALGAVRSKARHSGWKVTGMSANDAVRMLDEMATTNPELVASIWYMSASDREVKTFEREWAKHIEELKAIEAWR